MKFGEVCINLSERDKSVGGLEVPGKTINIDRWNYLAIKWVYDYRVYTKELKATQQKGPAVE